MQLKDLHLIHVRKDAAPTHGIEYMGSPLDSNDPHAFYLETCQRWIWVTSSEDRAYQIVSNLKVSGQGPIRGWLQGKEAYCFLLRLAAGLESRVIGETDIFGQLKEAWRKKPETGLGEALNFWFQKIFEDTKDIRTTYLQNLGGSSYGTLVRKMIKEQNRIPSEPVLIIGAGQVAQSIVPFLNDYELWLWNRTIEHGESLKAIVDSYRQHNQKKACELIRPEDEERAWKNAAQVVVCIPMDPKKDLKRINWLRENTKRLVIHLGGMRAHAGEWTTLPHLQALDDLFAIQSSQDRARVAQIAAAEKACSDRAVLRSLGPAPVHCWEDLSCFV